MRKRINYKNIFSMGLAVPVFSLAAVGNAQAQGIDAPSCEALGYDLTEADCAGRLFLKCPFDQTKYFCPDETSSTDCKVGDILYSDKTCSEKVISGKTPIAVVFNVEKGLAIALKTEKKAWSTSDFDVPGLTNYPSTDSVENDWAGKSNTNIVLNYCKLNNESCPAFEYVNTYTTAGTKAGDWYLPALGELNAVYVNIGVLNTALSKVGGTALPDSTHWSSSEKSSNYAWLQTFDYGYIGNGYDKNDSNYIRPVLAYKDSGSSGGNVGICPNPKVGDILYSDKSCSSEVISGKTPIAVVFNAVKRLAIGLNTEQKLWSTGYFDVPNLTNYSSLDSVKNDWAGKSNTNIVVSYCKSNSLSCPAFDYVNSYSTAGTEAGDWYLPALGEVNNIYENIAVLNRTLSLVGVTQIPTYCYHWSSSEYSSGSAWYYVFSDGTIDRGQKGSNFYNGYVRPVLEF